MATQTTPKRSQPDFSDDSRYERIDGTMVERPVPVEKHSEIQFRITQLLRLQIEPLGGKALQEWSVTQPSSADSSDPNYMTPDVVAVLPPIIRTAKGYLLPPALLAVEISSPEQSGLITKTRLLYDWGIQHIWIINPQTRECFEYHGGNQFIIATDELQAGDLRLSLHEIFQDIDNF